MTVKDINDIIKAVCPNDEDFEKPCISPKYLRQELEQLALDQRQWNEEPTTKNDLGVDCIDRNSIKYYSGHGGYMYASKGEIDKLPSVTPQPRCRECKWWKDSDGAFRRGIGAESQCPINTHAVYSGEGYCYKFSPKLEQEPVIDKIRAEIRDIKVIHDEYSQRQNDYCDGVEFAKRYVLQIIDKYKAEAKELDIDSAWVNHWKSVIEALNMAIDTMRKYEKIEDIYYYEPSDFTDAIDDAPTVEAIPKADYETRLRADMVAMLTEIQLEILELKSYESADGQDLVMLADIGILFQQKINKLKENKR